MPPQAFNGVKVFSATVYRQRCELGEIVEEWLAEHPTVRVADFVVTQSSAAAPLNDANFSCLSICVFYRDLSLWGSSHGELGGGE